jgi:cytoskeletal protein CcmA (bactofilin family)
MSWTNARDFSGVVANARRTAAQSVSRFKTAAGIGAGAQIAANDEAGAPADDAPARPDPSVLSVNTEMKGSISTTDELYIQGRMDGDVRATSIIVCEGGVVRGDLTADSITVYGAVTGNLQGGHVLLCAGAAVDGEIIHSTLGIDTGANFEGSIKRKPAAAE